ncbi:MAG: hypothetical protein AB8B48_09585 [Pseudomonadales bacterium]
MPKQEVVLPKSLLSNSTGRGHAQQGNLRFLEKAIHERWALGQNIVLCWTPCRSGIDLLMAPHYFLGAYAATQDEDDSAERADVRAEENRDYVRELISNSRLMKQDEFKRAEQRLELQRTSLKLPIPLSEEPHIVDQVEDIVKRHSISFVASRAVLLFDIVDFTLFSPFEQTSQLTSLSYSLNSAYNKLQQMGIDIDFRRTTTGDGFYVWARSAEAISTIHLFQFMLLSIADNAIAKRKSVGNTVPIIRTGFHVGSHYEFYQAEALNPTMNSYIVGEVTIELARMLDLAQAGQIFVGDFKAQIPTSNRDGAYLIDVDAQKFLERVTRNLEGFKGLVLSDEEVVAIHAYLTGETGISAGQVARRFKITDKHGRSRYAYNLRCNIHIKNSKTIIMGLQDYYLPRSSRSQGKSLADEKAITTLYPKSRQSPDITEER